MAPFTKRRRWRLRSGCSFVACLAACSADVGAPDPGDAADPALTPTQESVGAIQQKAALHDDRLWSVSGNAVSVRYRFDENVSDKAFSIWNLAMKRWEKLTRGRVDFTPLADSSPNPTGNWLHLMSHHSNIGRCGVGAASPTSCRIRDSSILGVGMFFGATVTIFADLGSNMGSKDNLQGADWESYLTVTPPNQPGTEQPMQIASLDYQSDGKLVTWYETDPIRAMSTGSYKVWRSKGLYPDLDDAAGPAAVSLPSGLDTAFTLFPPHTGSTLRGAAISADTVYTWWNVGSALKVARGSTTDLDSVETLKTVALPAGKTIADLIDMSFDGGVLNTWFVEDYSDYGSGILVPNSYRRYVGTYRDLDGANDDPGVVGGDIKGSNSGAALHELGHALGFIHEHQRADRDDYVWIDPSAIADDSKNYNKVSGAVNHSSFDFASIMHYKNSNVGRLDADHTAIPGNNSLSFHDVTGLCDAYGLATFTKADAWAASADSDIPLAFSPLSGWVDSDIVGADFSKTGVFYTWYVFNGELKRSWGHEWDLDANGSGWFTYPLLIEGAFANLIGIAIQRSGNGSVYAWYQRSSSSACPSGMYRGTGTSADLGAYAAPACVSVFDTAHDGDDIIDFAIDDSSGSDRVYTLYDDSTISVGSSTNLASVAPPVSYALPGGVAATRVYAFSMFDGVAFFHSRNFQVFRDVNFARKF